MTQINTTVFAQQPLTGETLTFPMTFGEEGVQVKPPLEGQYNDATMSVAVRETQVAAPEMADPNVFIPVVLGVAGAGAGVGYYAKKWLDRRAEARRQKVVEDEANDRSLTRTISCEGSALVLQDMFAAVSIRADPSAEGIDATITGKQSRIKQLSIKTDDDALTLTDVHRGDAMGPEVFEALYPLRRTTMLGRVLRRASMPRGLKILDDSDRLGVEVTVPEGVDLEVRGNVGSVVAQGNFGDTVLSVGARQQALIGAVQNLSLHAYGYSRTAVDAVDGAVNIAIGLGAKLTLGGGTARPLKVAIQMNSQLTSHARAEDATLDIGRSSVASLASVGGELNAMVGANSEVRVLDGRVDTAEVAVNEGGNFVFGGIARHVKAVLGTSATADFDQVPEYLWLNTGYGSKVQIGAGDIDLAHIEAGASAKVEINGTVKSGDITAAILSDVSATQYGDGVVIYRNGGKVRATQQ